VLVHEDNRGRAVRAVGRQVTRRRKPGLHLWRRVVGSAASVLISWLGHRTAAAADPDAEMPDSTLARPKISLSIEPGPCAGVSLEEIVPLARIELRSQVVEVEHGATHHIVVGCAGNVVTIAVAAPGGRARFRSTDLAAAPPAVRPRIVALVAAELVRNLDLAPMLPASPLPEIHRPVPDARAKTTISTARLATFAEASSFEFDGRPLLGGGLHFGYARGWLCGGLDAVLLSGSDRSDRGTTHTLLTYLSPHVDWRLMVGRLFLETGGGLAFGVVRMVGHPDDAQTLGLTVNGPWMAPYGALGLGYGLTAAFSIEARVLAGWVTLPVVGEVPGGREFGLKGFFGAVQAGAALSFF
jgi:hypothetical protein